METKTYQRAKSYGFDCEPKFYKYQLKDLAAQLKKICSVYITGAGILTLDASIKANKPEWTGVLREARWLSILQPVLVHVYGTTVLYFCGKKIRTALSGR